MHPRLGRALLTFVLAKPQDGLTAEEVCERIEAATELKAKTSDQFFWTTIGFGPTIITLPARTSCASFMVIPNWQQIV